MQITRLNDVDDEVFPNNISILLTKEKALNIHSIYRANNKTSSDILTKLQKLQKEQRSFKYINEKLIYDSKRGTKTIKLNGQCKTQNGENIVCRQLSLAVAKKNIKNYHTLFSNRESIEQIEELKTNQCDKEQILYRSRYYCHINREQFSYYLHHLATKLALNQEVTLLVSTENHVMAFTLQNKKVNNNSNIYVLKYYDPHNTSNNIRMMCTLDKIKSLRIENLVSSKICKKYFPKINAMMIHSPDITEKNELPYINMKGIFCAEQLYFAMMFGLLNKTKYLLNQVLSNEKLNAVQKSEMLLVKNFCGVPAISVAIAHHLNDIATCYFAMILTADFQINTIIELMNAKNKEGLTTLTYAMYVKNDTMVSFLLNTILTEEKFSIENKLDLIYAKDENGTPAIALALEIGNNTTVLTYLTHILYSKLTVEQKIEIILGKNQKNIPAICFAQKENTNLINDYLTAIDKAGLIEPFKNELQSICFDKDILERIDEVLKAKQPKSCILN